MQKGRVLNLRQFNVFFFFLKKNAVVIFLSLIFITGIWAGTYFSDKNLPASDILRWYMNRFVTVRTDAAFLNIFKSSFLFSFVFLSLLFIFGTSVTGVAFVPLFVALRGFFFGGISSLIYINYSFKGVALNAAVMIPPTLIFFIVMLCAARESLNFSISVSKLTFKETVTESLVFSFKRYCVRYFVFCVPTLLAALLDALLSLKLINALNII